MNLAELAAVVSDEAKAFELVEQLALAGWPRLARIAAQSIASMQLQRRAKASKKGPEEQAGSGLWKCGHCRKQFTVRVGSIFED